VVWEYFHPPGDDIGGSDAAISAATFVSGDDENAQTLELAG
jgi:hypothetical protein